MECENCFEDDKLYIVNIAQSVPLEYALPLYGYVMPVLVFIQTLTNSFIVVVLSQKHLRTPTNFVLLSMAIADLLTGLSSLPWFIYYYLLGGYELDIREGLDSFWCRVHPLFSHIIPSIWHTSNVWLTVFLAVQRYIYVCVPSMVHQICTPGRTRFAVFVIAICSVASELPNILGKWMERIELEGSAAKCVLHYSPWVLFVGIRFFYSLHYWFRVIIIHILPCILLTIFTYLLSRTIKKAVIFQPIESEFVNCMQEMRRKSCVSLPGDFQLEVIANGLSSAAAKKQSIVMCGGGVSGSGRLLYATTRMLATICCVFLLLEIPAAFIYILHFLIKTAILPNKQGAYHIINVSLIIRNILIVFTSPIQFFIYCYMSEQFRLTVRQLFSSTPLFIAQAQSTFHGGKRYSLILVDVKYSQKQAQRRQRQLLQKRKRSLQRSRRSSTPAQKQSSKRNRKASTPILTAS